MVRGFGRRLRRAVEDGARTLGVGSQTGGAQVLAIAAQKGGVGKTTSAVHLAVSLAMHHDRRVLLVDLDNQGHVASSLRDHVRARAMRTVAQVLQSDTPDLRTAIAPTTIEGLHVTSSDKALSTTEAQLAGRIGRELLLRRAMRRVRADYDVIILDCPPNLGLLTLNALVAADQVLVPCDLSILSLEGVDDLMASLEDIDDMFGRAPQVLGLLHTRVDRRNQRTNATIRAAVAERYAGLTLDAEIGVNTALANAQLRGRSIFHDKPDARGAQDYRALAAEVDGLLFSGVQAGLEGEATADRSATPSSAAAA